ncbi:MAG: helix-turn-helix domain-containing protein, partial [Sulfurovum sp.]|nr:helix-turn-helix transcriptional regulator [Sulfurovum sp.]NNJ45834.1 helix-turn-helix domain-containing protein [Sulfurovum sp.]
PIEFYQTTLQKLYKRKLDHSIEKPHRIGFNALFIVTQGKGMHTVDFIPYSYVKGTVFFIAKDQIHNFKVNPDCDGYILAFTDNFFNRLIVNEDLSILHDIFDYIYYPAKIHLNNDIYKDVLKLTQVLEKEYTIKIDNFKELILRPLLQALILKLSRERLSHELPLEDKDKSLYLQFKKLSLEHNYTVHVNDYAKMLDVSSKTLTNMSNKYLGKSTKKYLDAHLTLQIKRLLLDENLTIENIADKLCFDEPTNMVKFFKRFEGVTPLQFTKLHSL